MSLEIDGADIRKSRTDGESKKISRSLLDELQKYIDKVYEEELPEASFDVDISACLGSVAEELPKEEPDIEYPVRRIAVEKAAPTRAAKASSHKSKKDIIVHEKAPMPAPSLEDWMKNMDASFSETLLQLIDAQGKTDPEVYRRANVDRKLFSKIRNNPEYQPRKTTALAFAIALELNLDETKELIGRAGYALSHSSKLDIVVEYFIVQKNYDIFTINEALFAFDQPLLGC